MPHWAPSPPHLQHSELPHHSQRPIVAEAQCPAPLLRCSSFTGAVTRGSTWGSGPVTAPLQGLAVPSLFLAHWWESHARQVLAPWISQHPQTARVGPYSPLHPAELGRQVPAPATSQGVTWVPWPQAAPSGDNHPAVPGTRLHPALLPVYLIPHTDTLMPWGQMHTPCPMARSHPIPEPCLPCRRPPACPTVPSWGNHNPGSLF